MQPRTDYNWRISRDLDAMREAWQSLEARAVMSPFQSYAWIRNWHDHKGRGEPGEALIVSAWQGGRIVMLFPFALVRRLGGRQLRWLGDRWNDYNAPLIDAALFGRLTAADVGAIMDRIAREIGAVDCAILTKQPAALGGLAHPFAAAAATLETDSAHAIRLAGPGAKAGYGKTSLRRLREKEKALAKIGEVRFGRIADPLRKRDIAVQLLEWKARQLEARGARNPFRRGDDQYFLVRFAETNAEMAEIYALEIGSEVIAAALVIAMPGAALLYQMAYAAGDLSHHSPGQILLAKLIAALKADGRDVFDLSTGDDPYKFRLCDVTTPLRRSARIYAIRGVLPVAVEQGRLYCERTIKSNPALLSKVYLVNQFSRKILNRLKPAEERRTERKDAPAGLKRRDIY